MSSSTPIPDVSIALLTYNGGALLRRLLEWIRDQVSDHTVEVLAIDSGSTDGTVELLNEFGVRVIEIPNEEFDFGATRDLAYQNTLGKFVVNLSQDAVPMHEGWLDNLIVPLIENEKVAVSCGPSRPDPDRGYRQFPWEKNGYFYFTHEIRSFIQLYGKGVSFSNSAVRRSVWEELRFDPQPLGEDFQFQIKLSAGDWKRAYPEGAEVLHHHDYDLAGLWVRCRNEGLALRIMGCGYSEVDLISDLLSYRKYIQLLRELKRGSLTTSADFLFPVIRPFAVYMGSRFGKSYNNYRHRDPSNLSRNANL
jgi:rhamnosyltransferase